MLTPISSLRGSKATIHLFYMNDVLFLKGNTKNINSVTQAFNLYSNLSGQLVKWNKLFANSCASLFINEQDHIFRTIGVQGDFCPLFILVCLFFKGWPRTQHLNPNANKIVAQLASRKSKTLSLSLSCG